MDGGNKIVRIFFMGFVANKYARMRGGIQRNLTVSSIYGNKIELDSNVYQPVM